MAEEQTMCSYDAVRRFVFRWIFRHPFLPYQPRQITLYHAYPIRTEWKVRIEAQKRTVVNSATGRRRYAWPLTFRIQNDGVLVKPESMRLAVRVNGNIAMKGDQPYVFDESNRGSLQLEKSVKQVQRLLDVYVRMVFPETSTSDLDLQLKLSEDLGGLLRSGEYCDLELKPADGEENFRVHSCILRARWTNFFRIHPEAEIVDRTVETDISSLVLADLLIYLYTGFDEVVRVIHTKPLEYKEELSAVIRKYELEHLNERFGKHGYDSEIRNACNVYESPRTFRLPLLVSETWNDQSMPGVSVRFHLSFMARVNMLKYRLRFRFDRNLHARVIVEFVQSTDHVGSDAVVVVHEQDFEIREGAAVQTGSFHLEGYCRELDALLRGRREPGQSCRFLLRLTDGGVVGSRTERFHHWGEPEEQERRLQHLRDHIWEMLLDSSHADMKLVHRRDGREFQCLLYKAILAARIPTWRTMLQLPGGNPIPDEVSEIPDEVLLPISNTIAPQEAVTDDAAFQSLFCGSLIDLEFE